jgi:predicted Ser/Thr protein kinase/tetratricopeptide (TPR) repeat protein
MRDREDSGAKIEEASRHEALAGDLRALRPASDALKLELARETAERRLFGTAAPARIGRFVLLGAHAAGGMGVVYGAYDPQLDRRVALKLLHPHALRSPVTRERLLTEARALARLDHPNVVPIHDVVVIQDQVVIVMEWVEGKTLASWEAETPRSWREGVAMYLGAGRGLVAAHALGLVHRDFKPANAIIGEDGRVRILDFGLARFEGTSEGANPEPSSHAGVSACPEPGAPAIAVAGLTATGEVLGTPAYMAPEQLAGEVATAASDQFSFCAALYRAVCGVLPYPGATVEEQRASRTAGRLAEPADGRNVPGWLRAVLARGVTMAPVDRYPSMTALLDELGRERGWRRWRVPIAVVVTAVVALVTAGLAFGEDKQLVRCDGGPAAIEPTWNAQRQAALASAFARLHAPRAASVSAAVVAGLDGYRDAWVRMHHAACVDHRDGAQSDALLDRRMRCLHRRADALGASATALAQIDDASLDHAREVVAGLPPIDDCANLEVLDAAVEPPANLATRAGVTALQRVLAAAVARERLGQSAEALGDLRANRAEVARLGYAPLVVEYGLAEGRILLARSAYAEAQKILADVEKLALATGLLAPAVEAAARRIYCEAMESDGDQKALLRQAEVLEPLSHGLRGGGLARPLLLNNLGVVHMSLAQRGLARAAFAEARTLVAGLQHPDLELSAIDRNLAMLTPEDDARERLARGVWERRRSLLGDEHPSTHEALLSYGKYVRDPARALPLMTEACSLYRRHHPELLDARAHCGSYQGLLSSELEDHASAVAAYEEVVRVTADSTDAYLRVQHLLARADVSLERGELPSARVAFQDVLAGATGTAWWDRVRAATAHLGIARTWRTPEDVRTATVHLEQAIAIFEEVSTLNEDTEYKLRLALARMTLSELLREHGRAASAAALARLAADYYRAVGPVAYQRRLHRLGL